MRLGLTLLYRSYTSGGAWDAPFDMSMGMPTWAGFIRKDLPFQYEKALYPVTRYEQPQVSYISPEFLSLALHNLWESPFAEDFLWVWIMGTKKPSDFCDFLIFTSEASHTTTPSKKRNQNVTKGKNYFSELYMKLEIMLVIKEGWLTFMSWKDPYSQMP